MTILQLQSAAASDRLMLLPRNETACFAYWRISDRTKRMTELQEEQPWGALVWTLRCYDATGTDCDGTMASGVRGVRDVRVGRLESCYVDDLSPGRDYIADIGYTDQDGAFVALARSAPVRMPGRSAVEPAGRGASDADGGILSPEEHEGFCGYTVYAADAVRGQE